MCFSLGTLIGPMMGGELTDLVGYRRMTEYCSLAAMLIAFIHFLFIILPNLVLPPK
jgi:MFS family permease